MVYSQCLFRRKSAVCKAEKFFSAGKTASAFAAERAAYKHVPARCKSRTSKSRTSFPTVQPDLSSFQS